VTVFDIFITDVASPLVLAPLLTIMAVNVERSSAVERLICARQLKPDHLPLMILPWSDGWVHPASSTTSGSVR
jgi:hypothetical protein